MKRTPEDVRPSQITAEDDPGIFPRRTRGPGYEEGIDTDRPATRVVR